MNYEPTPMHICFNMHIPFNLSDLIHRLKKKIFKNLNVSYIHEIIFYVCPFVNLHIVNEKGCKITQQELYKYTIFMRERTHFKA